MLSNDITTDYPKLKDEEIELAIREGVRGRYGEYFGINTVTVCKWLDSYMRSEKRQEFLKNQMIHIAPAKQLTAKCDITEKEKEEIMRTGIQQAYIAYCRKDSSAIISLLKYLNKQRYEWLKKKGKITKEKTLEEYFEKCKRNNLKII